MASNVFFIISLDNMVNKLSSRLWFGKPWRSRIVPVMQANTDIFTKRSTNKK